MNYLDHLSAGLRPHRPPRPLNAYPSVPSWQYQPPAPVFVPAARMHVGPAEVEFDSSPWGMLALGVATVAMTGTVLYFAQDTKPRRRR